MGTVLRVFLVVTAGALAGMLLGGLFGFAAGSIAPDLFVHIIPWVHFEPVGVATVIGAAGGVLCGGALGVFAVIVHLAVEIWRGERRGGSGPQL